MATTSTLSRTCLRAARRPNLLPSTTTTHSDFLLPFLYPRSAFTARFASSHPPTNEQGDSQAYSPTNEHPDVDYTPSQRTLLLRKHRHRYLRAKKERIYWEANGGKDRLTERAADTSLLPFDRRELYDIISNIDAYKDWVPCCMQARPMTSMLRGSSSSSSSSSRSRSPASALPTRFAFNFAGYDHHSTITANVAYVADERVSIYAKHAQRPFKGPIIQPGQLMELSVKEMDVMWNLAPAMDVSKEKLEESMVWTAVSVSIHVKFWTAEQQGVWDRVRGDIAKILVRSLHKQVLLLRMEREDEGESPA